MYGISPPNMSDMGPRDTVYMPIRLSEALTVLYLFVHLLVPVGLVNFVLKSFSDYILSLFIIIKFAVYPCHFHINLIAYSVSMRDSPGVLSGIINIYLALLRNS